MTVRSRAPRLHRAQVTDFGFPYRRAPVIDRVFPGRRWKNSFHPAYRDFHCPAAKAVARHLACSVPTVCPRRAKARHSGQPLVRPSYLCRIHSLPVIYRRLSPASAGRPCPLDPSDPAVFVRPSFADPASAADSCRPSWNRPFCRLSFCPAVEGKGREKAVVRASVSVPRSFFSHTRGFLSPPCCPA